MSALTASPPSAGTVRASLSPSETAAIQALVAGMSAAGIHDASHSDQLVALARQVAAELGLDQQTTRDVTMLAMIHDIGKLGTPLSVLHKRDPLTADERAQLCRHPVIGARILSDLPPLAHLASEHAAQHERWDGLGYPAGLRGEMIPLASRIVAVCDSYIAMTEERPYRPPLPSFAATTIVTRSAGSQFCPTAAAALATVVRRRESAQSTATPPVTQSSSIAEPSLIPAAPAAPVPAIEHVERALQRQLRGRAASDRKDAAEAVELPLWWYCVVLVIGLAIGAMFAFPLPSASHLCSMGNQGAGQCELSKIWVPAAEKLLLPPLGLVLAVWMLSQLPGWVKRSRSVERQCRPNLVPAESDDPLLVAASWGLVMRDANADKRRAKPARGRAAPARSDATAPRSGAETFRAAAERARSSP